MITGTGAMIGGAMLSTASAVFGLCLMGVIPAPSLNVRERTGFYLLGLCMVGFVAGIIIVIMGAIHG